MSIETRFRQIVPLVLRAVALGMGVAVLVLAILGQAVPPAGSTFMLGLGLACLALDALQ